MQTFELKKGRLPLLVSLPHNSGELPQALFARMTEVGKSSLDTDWYVDRLYHFVSALGGSVLKPQWSRYCIDLNRPASGESLYPGQATTGLCPLTSFEGQPLYLPGCAPDENEIQGRVDRIWKPYHQALTSELERLKQDFSEVILIEGHSIASYLPLLFEGRLPDLNLGTYSGLSCASRFEKVSKHCFASQEDYTWVINGRFKGGYITRHYGQPKDRVHALQMEISQMIYLEEARVFSSQKANTLSAFLEKWIRSLLEVL